MMKNPTFIFLLAILWSFVHDSSSVANVLSYSPTSTSNVLPYVPKILTPDDCRKVSQEMSIKNIEILQPDSLPVPAHGGMKCRESRFLTCCSKSVERKLFQHSRSQFTQAYQERFNHHLTILNAAHKYIEKNFTEIITRSYRSLNSTLTLCLEQLYSSDPLMTRNLFSDMLNYLTDPTSSLMNISQRIEIFTDSLFSRLACHLVFQRQSLYSTVRCGTLSDCVVKQVMRRFKPIASRASEISHKITDSIRVARAVVNGVRVLIYVLEIMKEDNFNADCHTELMRMQLCSLCAGVPVIQACRPLCLHTIHRCLANFTDVVREWKKFIPQLINALDLLAESESFDYQLGKFPEQIRSLLSVYDQQRSRLHDQMLRRCPSIERRYFPNKAYSSRLITERTPPAIAQVFMPFQEFRSTIADIKSQMIQLQSFFSNLTSFICNKPEMSAPLSVITNCWNGTAVAKYSDEIYYQEPPESGYHRRPLNAALVKTLSDIRASIRNTLEYGKAYQWIMPEENFYWYRPRFNKKKMKSRKTDRKKFNAGRFDNFKQKKKSSQSTPPKIFQPNQPNPFMVEAGSGDNILNTFNFPNVPLFKPNKNYESSGSPTEDSAVRPVNLPGDDEDNSGGILESGSGIMPLPPGEYDINKIRYTNDKDLLNDGAFNLDIDEKGKFPKLNENSNSDRNIEPVAKGSTLNNHAVVIESSSLNSLLFSLLSLCYYRFVIGPFDIIMNY